MLDYKRYLKSLSSTGILALTCPHCGASTKSAEGRGSFCNFCEQYINVSDEEVQKEMSAEIAFTEIHAATREEKWDAAQKKITTLLQGSTDPRLFYISALFYLYLSDVKYRERDYTLHGFMEQNANNITASLDLTSKCKECFYRSVRLVKNDLDRNELDSNALIDAGFAFTKFMSEIKLHRFVDARKTLKMLHGPSVQSLLADYADMVYQVETNGKDVEASLEKMLSAMDINSFYYLAKALAKQKKLDEAEQVLNLLKDKANISMARELMNRIKSAQEASKM